MAAAKALEAALADEPRALDLYIRVAASYLRASEIVDLLVELGAAGRLGFEGLDAIRAVIRAARMPDDPWTLAHVSTLAAAAPACRRAALWGLERCVAELGWIEPHRAMLGQLRADADPDVAGAAWRLAPPREDEVP